MKGLEHEETLPPAADNLPAAPVQRGNLSAGYWRGQPPFPKGGPAIWHNLVSIGSSWQERAIRAIAVYLFLLAAIKLFGRRELGQLTAFDIIVILTLSNMLQNAMIGNDNSLA